MAKPLPAPPRMVRAPARCVGETAPLKLTAVKLRPLKLTALRRTALAQRLLREEDHLGGVIGQFLAIPIAPDLHELEPSLGE